ncbi:MAG TPA: hypothetical protein VFL83_13575 [Anaeromyxobacter sp.]|nr:hypothetical protein [Anaeromyxobacter sp.]
MRAAPPARFEAPLPRVQDFPEGPARIFGWSADDPRFPPCAHARDPSGT